MIECLDFLSATINIHIEPVLDFMIGIVMKAFFLNSGELFKKKSPPEVKMTLKKTLMKF
jgi:hypothetical protein